MSFLPNRYSDKVGSYGTRSKKGFKVDSHTDPILAYENFREDLYDLVLLDIKMPEVDGFHFYQKIRKVDSRVNFIMNSLEKREDSMFLSKNSS
jgi:DNA-binding response OmpR family regulator